MSCDLSVNPFGKVPEVVPFEGVVFGKNEPKKYYVLHHKVLPIGITPKDVYWMSPMNNNELYINYIQSKNIFIYEVKLPWDKNLRNFSIKMRGNTYVTSHVEIVREVLHDEISPTTPCKIKLDEYDTYNIKNLNGDYVHKIFYRGLCKDIVKKIPYKNFTKDGKEIHYDVNKNIIYECEWINGIKHGYEKEYDNNNKLKKLTKYDNTGKKIMLVEGNIQTITDNTITFA